MAAAHRWSCAVAYLCDVFGSKVNSSMTGWNGGVEVCERLTGYISSGVTLETLVESPYPWDDISWT